MKNWDKIILRTYKIIYRKSTPYANFKKLMDNATINEYGQKEIPFMDYEISEKVFNRVLNRVAWWNGFRRNKYWFKKYRTTILLGCSPKFKTN